MKTTFKQSEENIEHPALFTSKEHPDMVYIKTQKGYLCLHNPGGKYHGTFLDAAFEFRMIPIKGKLTIEE